MVGGIQVFLEFLTVILPVLLRLWTGHVMVRWFLWNLRSLAVLLRCGGIWWLLILHLIHFLLRLGRLSPVLRSLLHQSSSLLLRRFGWILLRWSYVLLLVLWLLLICHSISAVHWHGWSLSRTVHFLQIHLRLRHLRLFLIIRGQQIHMLIVFRWLLIITRLLLRYVRNCDIPILLLHSFQIPVKSQYS